MLIGYARVSTRHQDTGLQRDALMAAGVDGRHIFEDCQSGIKNDRPQLKAALEYVRPSDTLVVWKLDRLGRSLQDLIAIVNGLAQGEVGFRSLTEAIDTTTPGGKLIFHVFGAMAQFERDLLSERTLAGLEAARARGRVGGRPRALDPDQAALAREMRTAGKPVAVIARTLKVSRQTIYRATVLQNLPKSANVLFG
jgi:DNA invertase Pin-like site-specific DNA recombinase